MTLIAFSLAILYNATSPKKGGGGRICYALVLIEKWPRWNFGTAGISCLYKVHVQGGRNSEVAAKRGFAVYTGYRSPSILQPSILRPPLT